MTSIYDAIIIGTEISGLITAALLSKKGLKIALIRTVKVGNNINVDMLHDEGHLLVTGIGKGPLNRILADLNISLDSESSADISYQVITPEERIDICKQPEKLRAELTYAFPDAMDILSNLYRLEPSDSSIDKIMELGPFSFKPFAPSWIRKGKRPLTQILEGKGTSQRVSKFIMSQIFSFSYLCSPVSVSAATHLLASAQSGIAISPGAGLLKQKLMNKIKEFGGEFIEDDVSEVLRNGNRWLTKSQEQRFSSSILIGNTDVESFYNLFLRGHLSHRDLKAFKRTHGTLTVNLEISRKKGIPQGMSENVVLIKQQDVTFSTDTVLLLKIRPMNNGSYAMSINRHINMKEYRSENLARLAEDAMEDVYRLAPFIDMYSKLLDIRSPEDPSSGLFSANGNLSMGIGLVPFNWSHDGLYFTGSEVFPSLGFDGLIYSGEMAAISVYENLKKGNI